MGPNVADASDPDVGSRLWWALRRHLGVLVLTTLLTVTVAVAMAPTDDESEEYEAASLVVAERLDGIRPEHLPRMATAIFAGNTVATETVRRAGLPLEPEQLVPHHARVEIVEDTVVVRVVGTASQAREAAAISTVAAEVLVEELNRLGPDVGVFFVQETASAPDLATTQLGRPSPMILGLLGGALLGLGLVSLGVLWRRPVIHADEALSRVDAPLVGLLERRRAGHADTVGGLAGGLALVDELYPRRREVQVLVAASRPAVRSQVGATLATLLATAGAVVVVPARDRAGRRAARHLRQIPEVHLLEGAAGAREGDLPTRHLQPIPVVADGHPGVRLRLPASVRPVLIVPEGIPARQLDRVVRWLRPQQLRGVVWVAGRGGVVAGLLRRLPSRSRTGVVVAPAPAEPTPLVSAERSPQ